MSQDGNPTNPEALVQCSPESQKMRRSGGFLWKVSKHQVMFIHIHTDKEVSDLTHRDARSTWLCMMSCERKDARKETENDDEFKSDAKGFRKKVTENRRRLLDVRQGHK